MLSRRSPPRSPPTTWPSSRRRARSRPLGWRSRPARRSPMAGTPFWSLAPGDKRDAPAIAGNTSGIAVAAGRGALNKHARGRTGPRPRDPAYMRQFLECGSPKVLGYRDSERRAAMLVPSKQKARRRKPRAARPAPRRAVRGHPSRRRRGARRRERSRDRTPTSPRSHAPTRGRRGPREPPQPPHARRLHGTRRPRRRLALGRRRPKDLRHRRDGGPPGLNRTRGRTRRGHPSHRTVQAMADLREPHDCLAGEAHIAGTVLRTVGRAQRA